jgi:hypothetical protein
LVVAVGLGAFFILLGASNTVPGDEAVMTTIFIVSRSNAPALWLAAHGHDIEFANRHNFWKFFRKPEI